MHLVTSVVFVLATLAPVSALAQRHSEDAYPHVDAAYRARAAGDVATARAELERAIELGGDEQHLRMELGYLELNAGNAAGARSQFERAAQGPDRALAERARGQLHYLPNYLWMDVYFEGFGWWRFLGRESANFVPTLRLRGMLRPFLSTDVDFSFYLYGQITRDVSSRDDTPSGLPLIYADNHALLGGGALLRLLNGRLGIYAQAGPAFNLLDDGRDRISFDARIGVNGGIESDECRVPSFDGVRAFVGACVEGYGEVTYVSRFDHDIIGMLRGRAGFNMLLTGAVLWQPLIELRALAGKNGDFYNNFAEAGVGHRWRLLEPFGVDFITTLHGGAYYGVENIDPVPDPPYYLELRFLLVSYVEVR